MREGRTEEPAHARRLYLQRSAHAVRPPRRRARHGCGPTTCWPAVIAAVVEKSPFDPAKIEDVVVGCANQAGEDSRCVARHAGLLAGLPIEVAGSVLQRNCGSGLNAIVMAAQADHLRRGRRLCRRRGREHEPRALCHEQGREPVQPRRPGLRLRRSARAFRTRRSSASSAPTRCPRPPTTSPATTRSPARPATSSPRARSGNTPPAKADGFFAGEILAVEVPGGRAGPVKVAEDEHPRPQTDLGRARQAAPAARMAG